MIRRISVEKMAEIAEKKGFEVLRMKAEQLYKLNKNFDLITFFEFDYKCPASPLNYCASSPLIPRVWLASINTGVDVNCYLGPRRKILDYPACGGNSALSNIFSKFLPSMSPISLRFSAHGNHLKILKIQSSDLSSQLIF